MDGRFASEVRIASPCRGCGTSTNASFSESDARKGRCRRKGP